MLGYVRGVRIKCFVLLLGLSSLCLAVLQLILSSYLSHNMTYPIIIWWTPFMAENEKIINCYDKYTCLLTKDRRYRNNSNLMAYLFYGSNFKLADLPVPKDRIWAVFHEESPRNVGVFLHNRTWELFDIVATFSGNSDMPLTLQYLENLDFITSDKYYLDIKEKNEYLNSISPVLYVQSDCDTPVERDKYVKELMKYVPVDSYGACLKNKEFPEEFLGIDPLDLFNEKFLKFVAKYKFVIAFENAICDDYITEKLWRPLYVGSVPIYLGSPSIEKWLPNKNSAILVQNFQSVKSLADYVNKVNSDDSLYMKFLDHKFGTVENDLLKMSLAKGPFGVETEREHPIPAFECFLCEKIYNGSGKKKLGSVYDCPKPQNGWMYHWELGECQSLALEKFVKNGGKYDESNC